MKTIKDAVIELGGKLPCNTMQHSYAVVEGMLLDRRKSPVECYVCKVEEFKAEAKRLGYINGYRWGVEYPTNGERPDLADDVIVELRYLEGGIWFDKAAGDSRWQAGGVVSFRITDPRFKPAGTSYLDAVSEISENKPDCESVSESLDCKQKTESVSENHIVEANEKVFNARTCWPPVAGMAVELWFGGQYVENVEFLCERGGNVIFWRYSNDSVDSAAMPTAELKPIRTEREKVIEAAVQVCTGVKIAKVSDGLTMNTLNKLYNAGMLKMPE